MLEVVGEKLTERERECVGHFRQAQGLKVSFAEYCRSFNLNANAWHLVKLGMRRKGLIPPTQQTSRKRPQAPSAGFVAVQITPTANVPATLESGSRALYRVRHLNGWTIECEQLPPLEWLRQLCGDSA